MVDNDSILRLRKYKVEWLFQEHLKNSVCHVELFGDTKTKFQNLERTYLVGKK